MLKLTGVILLAEKNECLSAFVGQIEAQCPQPMQFSGKLTLMLLDLSTDKIPKGHARAQLPHFMHSFPIEIVGAVLIILLYRVMSKLKAISIEISLEKLYVYRTIERSNGIIGQICENF